MPSRNALVTVAIGSHASRMALATHPLMRAYASRCHADFVVIQKPCFPQFGMPHYEKVQIFSLFAQYERILFVDNDVLISPESPNVFDMVPIEVFAAASEETWSKYQECKQAILAELGMIEWDKPYFNSGVMLASRAHRMIFDPSCSMLSRWATDAVRKKYPYQADDQTYFNYRLNELKYPMLDLGFRYNHTRTIAQTQTRFRSFFIHYAGPSGHRYGDKLAQIDKDARALASPFVRWLSQRSLAYRWFADRFDIDFVRYLLRGRV